MMHYFYHLDYPPQEGKLSSRDNPQNDRSTEASVSNLTIHARVYGLAEKYQIRGLKTAALGKFKEEALVHWLTADFRRAVEEVYMSTVSHDRGMRYVVVDTIVKHRELLDLEGIQNLVRRLDLCFDLVMRFKRERDSRRDTPVIRKRNMFQNPSSW